jgi:hypothetical protein
MHKFGEGVQLQLLQLGFWILVGLSLAWCATLGERCATLVGYLSASRIIMSVMVKVLGGVLCAYGWVTILLYCLWKNEHISLFLTEPCIVHSVSSEALPFMGIEYASA